MHEYYLRLAYIEAIKSPDPSNQNGAILVANNVIVAKDYNSFPEKLQVTEEMIINRQKKYLYIEHAERNVIYQAIRKDIYISDCILYCPWLACVDCSRAIILSGIKKTVGHQARMCTTPIRWKESIANGLKMMANCDVQLEFYDKPIPDCPSIIVNGELWNPGD